MKIGWFDWENVCYRRGAKRCWDGALLWLIKDVVVDRKIFCKHVKYMLFGKKHCSSYKWSNVWSIICPKSSHGSQKSDYKNNLSRKISAVTEGQHFSKRSLLIMHWSVISKCLRYLAQSVTVFWLGLLLFRLSPPLY